VIDREFGDGVIRDAKGNPESLETDFGRAFLYARYDAELTAAGLKRLGVGHLDPAAVSKLDSVAHMGDLRTIGKAVAQQVSLAHFGRFAAA
jgi:hypothetical protein